MDKTLRFRRKGTRLHISVVLTHSNKNRWKIPLRAIYDCALCENTITSKLNCNELSTAHTKHGFILHFY